MTDQALTPIEPTTPATASTLAATLAAAATRLAAQATAPNTRLAYASDERAWLGWTALVQADPSLPVAPALALAWAVSMHETGLAVATIRRRLAGLAAMHRAANYEPPGSGDLARVLAGIAREQVEAPRGRGSKRAMDPSMIAAALPTLSHRDRAVLLVGMATGCRRAELAALQWEQVKSSGGGVVIVLGSRKRGPAGQCVGVPRGSGLACPVAALRDLRREQGSPTSGLVFGCTAQTIATIVQRAAEQAGENGSEFGGHSLRAGMITTASGAGVSLASIMGQSGHASASIAAGYCRHDDAASNPAPRAVVAAMGRACGGAS